MTAFRASFALLTVTCLRAITCAVVDPFPSPSSTCCRAIQAFCCSDEAFREAVGKRS